MNIIGKEANVLKKFGRNERNYVEGENNIKFKILTIHCECWDPVDNVCSEYDNMNRDELTVRTSHSDTVLSAEHVMTVLE